MNCFPTLWVKTWANNKEGIIEYFRKIQVGEKNKPQKYVFLCAFSFQPFCFPGGVEIRCFLETQEADEHGPIGRRCFAHGARQCNVDSCHRLAKGSTNEKDQWGPPGRRTNYIE